MIDTGMLQVLADSGGTFIIAVLFYFTTKAQSDTYRESVQRVCDSFDKANQGLLERIRKWDK
jgi:hypothetical protein